MRLPSLLLLASLADCARAATLPDLAQATPPISSLLLDTHLHLTMKQAAKPLFRGEPDDGAALAGSPSQFLVNQVDSPSLRAVGMRLVVASLWPPFALRPGRDARDEALTQVAELKRFCERHPAFAMARTADEARSLLASGFIALWPAVEGGEGLGTVDDVDLYYAAGVRSVTLTHFGSNGLGGGAANQIGRHFGVPLERREPQGLTELGRAVVRRMFQLGILVDLAHASDATASDVLAMAEAAGVPVFNSHTGARAFLPMERNLSDEMAARIGRLGGMVSVTLYRDFIRGVPSSERWPGYVDETCDNVLAHWLHLARVVGPERVALGSDFNGLVLRPRAGGSCPRGIRNSQDLPTLYAALEARGIPKAALEGTAEQFLSMLAKVEARAEPSAQAAAKAKGARAPIEWSRACCNAGPTEIP